MQMGRAKTVTVDELETDPRLQGAHVIRESLQNVDSPFEIFSKISIKSIDYKSDTYVVLTGNENGGFKFGKILFIFREEESDPKLVIKHYQTNRFDQHTYCYLVEEVSPVKITTVLISDLLDFHPLDAVTMGVNVFIRLKYFLATD